MESDYRILVVDDEKAICDVLKLNLTFEGYEVDVAYSAEDALKRDLSRYSLFLLDVMMGEMSGFELAAHIRASETVGNVPIIFCTAKSADDDLVKGFNTGADDYIRKPFSMKELMARVKNALKRTQLTPPRIVEYQGLKLDKDSRLFSIDGEKVDLTKKEFELMKLFLTNMDRIFTREEILDNIWGKNIYVVDRTIDVNINRLRKKLGVYGKNIETKLGYGYGFFK